MWKLYETRLNAYGETPIEREIEKAKEDFRREALKNPSYQKVIMNGEEEELLVTRTEVPEKFKITAFPDKDIVPGDYVELWDEIFIITQTRVQNTLNKTGYMMLCNNLFRWQDFDGSIIEKWGVLDSGVYSTTIRGEKDLKYLNKQYKIIFPLDEDTEKLFIDKRLAVDTMYDRFGKQILNVYQITGFDSTSESFGKGGHILYLNIRSDEYNSNTDNIELRICDYKTISEDTENPENLLNCEIVGSDYIRIGTSRKYKSGFFDVEGNEVSEIVPSWEYINETEGITATTCDDGRFEVVVNDDRSLVGNSVEIGLSADGYISTNKTISIIGL